MLNSPRRWFFIGSPLIIFLFLYYVLYTYNQPPVAVAYEPWNQSTDHLILDGTQPPPQPSGTKISIEEEQCGHLRRDMDDVLVILKTGATEAQEKVPVQLRTGLQCVPHFAVFSDYEEVINGVRTYDILQNVSQAVMDKEPEFEFYKRLQEVGLEGLTEEDWGDDTNGPFGKVNNPGWKLDKWKFLPMAEEAMQVMPDAKWYIFIEADTYIVWQNLVNWLAHLDHTRSYYLGSPMQIGETLFGYGGSGVILSNKAMTRLHTYQTQALDELEQLTATEWAGDCILAKALEGSHIYLTWAWPMMMTSRPSEVDHFSEAYGRQPWCYPVISYHHMNPDDIEEMWQFDRGWFQSGKNALLLHADVYREYVHNGSLSQLDDWDNLSGADIIFDEPTLPSVDSCADACMQNSECLQYSFHHEENSCKHAATTLQGVRSNGTSSGWIPRRVQKLLNTFQSSCPQVEYILN
ncbi:hypothetical protein N7466_003471 [Penicillium verhagenii]|uniref:uncharacterized protein n=1 Tax=Penicillium verhagenii TaxID=1562060 RepID=UPI002544E388|nr:uncharacterized protein N7466_003471 [Penicillium verhagenii]KAJ5937021.1 hypothetical protein N7466_003471 [Penicillium verhagenii]